MKDVKIILNWELDDMKNTISMITEKICSLQSELSKEMDSLIKENEKLMSPDFRRSFLFLRSLVAPIEFFYFLKRVIVLSIK